MTIPFRLESVPQTWDAARDNDFFRIVASLFAPDFVYGAGVLLATNDTDEDEAAHTAACHDDLAFAVVASA